MTVPQPNFILEAALAYAAKGWRIFPCDPHAEKPRSKRPLVVADKDDSGNSIDPGLVATVAGCPDRHGSRMGQRLCDRSRSEGRAG